MNIKIEPLTISNFNEHSLDDFRRRQQVTEVWRRNGNEMELVYQPFVEDWDAELRRAAAERMLGNLRRGYFGTGAFDGGKLVGWTFYGNELIGERKNYVELHMFHVSELYRGKGIGRRVFEASLPLVRETGAERIFISSHSAKESQAAYKALGCVPARELFREAAEMEPFDIQLEFELT